MTKGNINSALNLLANNMENGILQLNNDTLSKFIQKHPKSKAASQDILLNDPSKYLSSQVSINWRRNDKKSND